MQQEGMDPGALTFVGILNACANVMALEKGRCIHERIAQSGFESNVFVGNSLVDLYAKFGSIEDAWRVFSRMPMCNVVAWTTIFGSCEMWSRATGTSILSTNVFGRGGAKSCLFCGS
jgi:pentatricopeptide repeat protein